MCLVDTDKKLMNGQKVCAFHFLLFIVHKNEEQLQKQIRQPTAGQHSANSELKNCQHSANKLPMVDCQFP